MKRDETKMLYHYQWVARSEMILKITFRELEDEKIKNWPSLPAVTYSILQRKL